MSSDTPARYDPTDDCGRNYGHMEQQEDGDFVRWEDYISLLAERDAAINANLNNVNNYAWQVKELRELLVRCREGLWHAGFSNHSPLVVDLDRALVEGGGR